MTNTIEIKCINKNPRNDAYTRITHVGGFTDKRWKITLDDAIGYIESKEWAFYTTSPQGHRRNVIVASRLGRKYLKTEADHDTPDNLLSLAECP